MHACIDQSFDGSVSMNGPNGVIETEEFKFGPGGLYVHTRVVADDTPVTIEQP